MHIVKEVSIFVQITIFCSKCWNKNEVCPDGKLDESYLSKLYFNLILKQCNITTLRHQHENHHARHGVQPISGEPVSSQNPTGVCYNCFLLFNLFNY